MYSPKLDTTPVPTRLNDKVADGGDHHQLPSLPHLRTPSDAGVEKGVAKRPVRLQLSPPHRTPGAFVHSQTRFFVDVDPPSNSRQEPARKPCMQRAKDDTEQGMNFVERGTSPIILVVHVE